MANGREGGEVKLTDFEAAEGGTLTFDLVPCDRKSSRAEMTVPVLLNDCGMRCRR